MTHADPRPDPGASTGSERPASGLSIAGGRGGTSARLTDLERAAAVVAQAAGALQDAAWGAVRLLETADVAATWSPGTAPAAVAAAAGLRSTAGRAGAAAQDLAGSLRAAAALYARTDLDVTGYLQWVAGNGARALGDAGPVAWVGTGAAALIGALAGLGCVVRIRALRSVPGPVGLLATAGTRALGEAPGPVGVLLGRTFDGPGPLPAWATSAPVPRVGAVDAAMPVVATLVGAAAPGPALPHPDVVERAAGTAWLGAAVATRLLRTAPSGLVVSPTRPAEHPPAPRTVADVLTRVEQRYPASGGEPGSVEVQRLDHPDGTRSWVVAIPGTQVGSPLAGTNPADMTSNLALVAGRPQDASALVVRSMELAGVGPGEPVLLVGHSQGGLVAMDVAADLTVRAPGAVTTVVTAGSPVAGAALPDGVVALHLEHHQDLVPGLEGAPNPDTAHRTTVRRDLGASPEVADRIAAGSIAEAHGLAAYLRTARALEGSPHPSVRGVDTALAAVLGSGDAAVTSTVYQGVRIIDGGRPPP